jgi:hypothetical protein
MAGARGVAHQDAAVLLNVCGVLRRTVPRQVGGRRAGEDARLHEQPCFESRRLCVADPHRHVEALAYEVSQPIAHHQIYDQLRMSFEERLEVRHEHELSKYRGRRSRAACRALWLWRRPPGSSLLRLRSGAGRSIRKIRAPLQ